MLDVVYQVCRGGGGGGGGGWVGGCNPPFHIRYLPLFAKQHPPPPPHTHTFCIVIVPGPYKPPPPAFVSGLKRTASPPPPLFVSGLKRTEPAFRIAGLNPPFWTILYPPLGMDYLSISLIPRTPAQNCFSMYTVCRRTARKRTPRKHNF